MTASAPVQLRAAAEITFRGITLRGELTHVPEDRLLVITSDTEEEVLTTETPESDLARAEVAVAEGVLPQQLVTVKNYSEHAGMPVALEAAGIIRILSRFSTGPFSSPIAVAQIL